MNLDLSNINTDGIINDLDADMIKMYEDFFNKIFTVRTIEPDEDDDDKDELYI